MLSTPHGTGNLIEHDAQNSFDRDAFVPGADVGHGLGNGAERAANDWTESYLAACLLQETRREGKTGQSENG
jgi:hypothetical protein